MVLTIHRVVTGRWRENCYVAHESGHEAVIIDPGADVEQIEVYVAKTELEVKGILLTHGHFDHIGAVAALRRRYEVPCLLHQADHRLVRRANLYRLVFESEEPIEVPSVDSLPASDAPIAVAGLEIETLHTPGHTPGGVCFLIGGSLFSGDTLHQGRRGRVDLPGGDSEQLVNSLRRLSELPRETRVHPGHGEATTIGAELDRGALASIRERT